MSGSSTDPSDLTSEINAQSQNITNLTLAGNATLAENVTQNATFTNLPSIQADVNILLLDRKVGIYPLEFGDSFKDS
jgi:hypothetical protein